MKSTNLKKSFNVDKLKVEVYGDRASMGAQAAGMVSVRLRELLSSKGEVRMIFAAAPSQNEMLDALATSPGINWNRVTAFHMDEYVGLMKGAEESFGTFLNRRIFSRVEFGKVHYINSAPESVTDECERYSRLLGEAPIDIVCLGIGENGHIAFNDPGVADFNDPHLVKVVRLDDKSRRQQVNDGCFPSSNDVPREAISLTVPALVGGGFLCAVVPGPTKAEAVRATLNSDVTTECPATILRSHSDAVLFLDVDSASRIEHLG